MVYTSKQKSLFILYLYHFDNVVVLVTKRSISVIYAMNTNFLKTDFLRGSDCISIRREVN